MGSVAIAAGCAEPATHDLAESSLAFPLAKQIDGKMYRLRATFQVTTPDNAIHVLDGTGDDPDVSLVVPPGRNRIELLDGWTLSSSTDGGMTFAPVDAVIATVNPVNLIVSPNRVTVWTFEFIVRNPNNELHVTFGVTDPSRQLTVTVLVTEGFGDFAVYQGAQIQMTSYFLGTVQHEVEDDGTRDLVFRTDTVASEFSSDPIGLLTPLAKQFTGGIIEVVARNHPDGTQDARASYQGFSAQFPEVAIDPGLVASVPVDPDGFPSDGAFFSALNPFALSLQGTPVLNGTVLFFDAFR